MSIEFNPDGYERRPATCTLRWTAERDARLKQMWDDGLTTANIAIKLGGTTKNACIGRAHRIGCRKRYSAGDRSPNGSILPTRRSMGNVVKKVKATRPLNLPMLQIGSPDTVEPIGGRKSILEVGLGECRWPAPGAAFACCSHQQREGSSYCDYHAMKSHEKPRVVTRMQARYSIRTGVMLA